MKTTTNPWPYVFGMVAIMIVCLSMAISRYYVMEAREEAADARRMMESEREEAKQELRKVSGKLSAQRETEKSSVDEQQTRMNERIRELEIELSTVDLRISNARKLGHAEALLEQAQGIRPSSGVSTYQRASVSLSAASEVKTPAPLWQLPPAFKAKKIIKDNAEKKWGTNYEMVEYAAKLQSEAYDKIDQYQKQRWKPVVNSVINEAGAKWGTNYEMVLYQIENQLEAKAKLEGR